VTSNQDAAENARMTNGPHNLAVHNITNNKSRKRHPPGVAKLAHFEELPQLEEEAGKAKGPEGREHGQVHDGHRLQERHRNQRVAD
jgi:hypothetical protein